MIIQLQPLTNLFSKCVNKLIKKQQSAFSDLYKNISNFKSDEQQNEIKNTQIDKKQQETIRNQNHDEKQQRFYETQNHIHLQKTKDLKQRTQIKSNQIILQQKQQKSNRIIHNDEKRQTKKQQSNPQQEQQPNHLQQQQLALQTKLNTFQIKSHITNKALINKTKLTKQKQISTNQSQPKQIINIVQNHRKNNNKFNPRHNKFIKLNKSVIQQTRNIISKQQDQEYQALTKSKQLLKIQLKQKNLKKLQLQEKLKKLNQQLQKQKKSKSFILGHNQSIVDYNMEDSQTSLQKSAIQQLKQSIFINYPSQAAHQASLKSSYDLKSKKKYIQNYQQAYSPTKHQQARKFVQKMHQEKLKKHQKYLQDLRKKQEYELITLRKLEEERIREKIHQRSRILLKNYTPKSKSTTKSSGQFIQKKSIFQQIKQRQKNSKTTESKSFFNKRKLSSNIHNNKKQQNKPTTWELQKQPKNIQPPLQLKQVKQKTQQQQPQPQIQIGSVIPHQKHKLKSYNKIQTLYTQQFQPVTQEGKEFADMLNNPEKYEKQEIVQDKKVSNRQQQKVQNKKFTQQIDQNERYQQNQFDQNPSNIQNNNKNQLIPAI